MDIVFRGEKIIKSQYSEQMGENCTQTLTTAFTGILVAINAVSGILSSLVVVVVV